MLFRLLLFLLAVHPGRAAFVHTVARSSMDVQPSPRVVLYNATPVPPTHPPPPPSSDGDFTVIVVSVYAGMLVLCFCASMWWRRRTPLLQDQIGGELEAVHVPMLNVE